MARLKLLAVAALIGGPILSYVIRNEVEERKLIETEGVTVPGIITDGKIKSKRGSKSYKFDVTYVSADGGKVTKNFSVPKTFAEQYVQNDAFVRYDVEVRHLPKDPQKSFIVGGSKPMPELEYVGYGLAAVGAIGTYFSFRRKKETLAGGYPTAS
jgi:hypothetical protein